MVLRKKADEQEYKLEIYAHNHSYKSAKGLKNRLWDFVRKTP